MIGRFSRKPSDYFDYQAQQQNVRRGAGEAAGHASSRPGAHHHPPLREESPPDRENPERPSEPIEVKDAALSETARIRVRNAFRRFWTDKRG